MNVQSLAFLAFLTVTVCACRLLGRKGQVWALLDLMTDFYADPENQAAYEEWRNHRPGRKRKKPAGDANTDELTE